MADSAPWANDTVVGDSADSTPWGNDKVVGEVAKTDKEAGTSLADVGQSTGSAFWSGVTNVAGLPVDVARHAIELGKAGTGYVYHEATGNEIPDALQPNENPEGDVLGSEWIKDRARAHGLGNFVDVSHDTPITRGIHTAVEGATTAALTGGEAAIPSVARAAVGGAAASLAQQKAADAGYDTAGQTIASLIGGVAGAESPRLASGAKRVVVDPVVKAGSAVADAASRAVDAVKPPTSAASDAAMAARRAALGYDAPTSAPSKPSGFTADSLAVEPTPPRQVAPESEATSAGSVRPTEAPPGGLAVEPTPNGGQPTKADPWAGDSVVRAEPTDFAVPHNDGHESAALPDNEQAQRVKVLREIGLDETRHSAITGNTSETGTDFQASKLDNAAGKRMGGVIDNENAALRNYAEQRVAESAGSTGDDQAARYGRGSAIVAPINQLSDYFDRGIKQVYRAADQKAGETPFAASALHKAVSDRSQFLGTVEGKQLLEGVQARMQDLGLRSSDGMPQPATVQQAERLRQFLNDQWTPRTARLISSLKDAVDDDVAKAAGTDVYKSARAMRATRAAMLDDPNGIAKLAEADDRNGINRSVALEKVPDYVANLPVQQFQHIVTTLKNVPAELRPQAAAALNEIRAHFANRVNVMGNSTQGMWNAKGVNKYLRDNVLRMREVFTPEEIGRYQSLNEAGRVLKMDRTYPGAEAQRYNFAAKGLNSIGEGAPAMGSHLGGLAGYAVGHAVGTVAGKGAEKLVLRTVEKRIRKL
jgi:hypothetical protein